MISSTTPLFTAFFAYLMVGEVGGNWLSYVSLVCIALGAALATGGEPMWHALGFFLALLSTVLRAFKAVLQQVRCASALHASPAGKAGDQTAKPCPGLRHTLPLFESSGSG